MLVQAARKVARLGAIGGLAGVIAFGGVAVAEAGSASADPCGGQIAYEGPHAFQHFCIDNGAPYGAYQGQYPGGYPGVYPGGGMPPPVYNQGYPVQGPGPECCPCSCS